MSEFKLIHPAGWNDYELIDSGAYEKLERFGDYILSRPEPQACWNKSLGETQWEQSAHARFIKAADKEKNTEKGRWVFLKKMPEQWFVNYAYKEMKLRFRLGLTAFKHVGLFPEQSDNWNFIYDTLNAMHSPQTKVLNLFAYTCGVGLSAAAGGAREVCNLDFAEGNLAVGRENGVLNPQLKPMKFVQSDYFPAIRQLAGLPIAPRRGNKLPEYVRLEQRQYDLVFLDPPAWAKSAFGTVDLLRDYQSLLKPAVLATATDGVLICCNNLAKVSMEDWREQVLRCASKAGRPVRDCQVLTPGSDFPSQDQQPPLKTLILQL